MSHSRLEPGALDQQLNRVAEQLHRDFSDEVSSAEATAEVFAEAEQFRDARITRFVPALVHRAVHDRLRRRRFGSTRVSVQHGLDPEQGHAERRTEQRASD